MARHQTIHRAVLTAALLAIAAGAAAQPLADAARRAEEQRKASAVEPLVLKQPPRPVGPVVLTHDLVRQYLDARIALADLRRGDRQLDFRLRKTMSARVIQYYVNFIPILESELAITDTLAGFGFTPASYIFVEESLMRGRSFVGRREPALVSGAHAENIRFVLENREFVESVLSRGLQAEHKLQSCCIVLLPS